MSSKNKAIKTMKGISQEIKRKEKRFQKTGWKEDGLGGRYIPESMRNK